MTTSRNVYYRTLNWKGETMYLAATDNGLCWAGGFNEGKEVMEAWLNKSHPDVVLKENKKVLEFYIHSFKAYFSGEKMNFDIPLDLTGTPFQMTVWETLRNIPYGETRTYSDIALAIGNEKAIRAVGTAIGRNPVLIAVPCHRVIQKNGSLGGFRAGLPLKETLLQLEYNQKYELQS